jgi:hypothetical protein
LITLCSIYDLTRDPRHLAAADRIVDYVLRCQDQKSGGWTSPASYTPYRGSSSAFINFLSRGLGYYAELTGDTRVANSLAMAGRWAIDDRKSPLGYAEVVAVSTSHSDQWGRLSQAARKDLDASFGGKEVPASSVGGANPRELAHAIIRYNRLMGAVQKAQ